MKQERSARLHAIAGRLQRLGLALSALFGCLVGLSFALGTPMAWEFAFGGFISLLWVGMAVVVLSAVSERIPAGDWREGLRLNCRIFLAQTTIYGASVLALALTPFDPVSMPVARLAMAFLPGLYLCNVLAIVLSAPLYLRWLAVPPER